MISVVLEQVLPFTHRVVCPVLDLLSLDSADFHKIARARGQLGRRVGKWAGGWMSGCESCAYVHVRVRVRVHVCVCMARF